MKEARKSAGLTVEQYLAGLEEGVRAKLREVHGVIAGACPAGVVEVISYAMPAFALVNAKGVAKPFFGYAAFMRHYGLFPFSGSLLGGFAEELAGYTRTKGGVQVPYERAVPTALIRKLVKARVRQITGA